MKKLILILSVMAVTACSPMKAVEERETYAQPDWYKSCVQSGSEGIFWSSKEFVYACGAGESRYAQAAEEQMYAVAMNNFAKRINSRVHSSTEVTFFDDKKSTKTVISYVVADTAIKEHLIKETGHFTMANKHYTFVRLKMPKKVFDNLVTNSYQ